MKAGQSVNVDQWLQKVSTTDLAKALHTYALDDRLLSQRIAEGVVHKCRQDDMGSIAWLDDVLKVFVDDIVHPRAISKIKDSIAADQPSVL